MFELGFSISRKVIWASSSASSEQLNMVQSTENRHPPQFLVKNAMSYVVQVKRISPQLPCDGSSAFV